MGHTDRLILLAFPTGLTLGWPRILGWGVKTLNGHLKFKTFPVLYYYVCIYTWVSAVIVARAWSMKIIQKNKVSVVTTSAVFLVPKFASSQEWENKVLFLIRQFHKLFCLWKPLSTRVCPSSWSSHRQLLHSPSVSSPLPEATKRITESRSVALCFSAGSCTVCEIHFDTNLN